MTEQCAFAMGQELHAVGVNFNLAPVVDVNSNPQNPVIGARSTIVIDYKATSTSKEITLDEEYRQSYKNQMMRYVAEVHKSVRNKAIAILKDDKSAKNKEYVHYWDCNSKYLVGSIESESG